MTKNPTEAGKNGQYFEQRKKGEMNELKNLLNKVINEQDLKKGRDVVRKVIGYMTLGMDASPVFSEMCRASYLNDEVMKKMIYFYLTTYAEDNSDLAIMAVNTFQKDCKHSSSRVRGLALRNLCSFKSADYVNNVLPTIRELLTDFEPYVKKTAIMGLLKVFYYEPATIYNDETIISTLSELIRDHDTLVSCNALIALEEILISEGGVSLTPKLVRYLYNRLKQYQEWQQTQILDILYKYTPQTDSQHLEIMTILWQKLKLSSASMVLGSIRIIIKLAREKQELFHRVVDKIKAPLLTLMSSKQNMETFETMFIILQHIEYVIVHMDGKKFYENDFKYFYCKMDEPTYIKEIKVKILGLLANQFNLGDMLNELNEYGNDIDEEIARKSVQVLATIALALPEVSKALMVNLMSFYRSEKVHLINQTMVAFYKILKRYPKLFSELKPHLVDGHSSITEPEAIRAFIWIVGTFATQIDAAPYILEQYIESQDKFHKYPDSIKSVLLTQIVETFLKRPPQTHRTMATIFRYIFSNDATSMVVRDHASFYYRALKDNVEEVRRGFSIIEADISKYKEESKEVSVEDDFNSLSLAYGRKQNTFIKNYDHFISMRNKQLGLIQPAIEEDLMQDETGEQKQQNYLEFEDNPQKNDHSEKVEWPESIEADDLQQGITLTAEQFQQTWNNLPNYEQQSLPIQNEEYLDQEQVECLFKMWKLYTMASASEDNLLKFFIYGKHTSNRFIVLQLNIDKNEKNIHLTTKAQEAEFAQLVNSYIKQFLRVNQFIE